MRRKLAPQDTPIPRGEQRVVIVRQGANQDPPPDHEDFDRLQKFALKGYKKGLDRRRK